MAKSFIMMLSFNEKSNKFLHYGTLSFQHFYVRRVRFNNFKFTIRKVKFRLLKNTTKQSYHVFDVALMLCRRGKAPALELEKYLEEVRWVIR